MQNNGNDMNSTNDINDINNMNNMQEGGINIQRGKAPVKSLASRGEVAFAQAFPDGTLGCELCPRFCRMSNGDKGWCGSRFRKRDRMWAANHNWISVLKLARIEAVPLAEYASGATVLKLGSFGCNFRPPRDGRSDQGLEAGMGRTLVPGDVAGICRMMIEQGCIGAAYVYGEPLMWYEFVMESAMLLHQCDMKNILATGGFVNKRPLHELMPYLDAVRFDLFSFDPAYYRDVLKMDMSTVLHSLWIVANSGVHFEVATPYLRGVNDGPEEIARAAKFIGSSFGRGVPYHVIVPEDYREDVDRDKLLEALKAANQYLENVYLS